MTELELNEIYQRLRSLRDSIDRVLQYEQNRRASPYSFNISGCNQSYWWKPPTDNVTFTYYPRTTTAGKR